MKYSLNLPRCRRLIDEAIRTLGLDLTGLTVLTEAGTGPFSLTASIVALAGAPRVLLRRVIAPMERHRRRSMRHYILRMSYS